MRRASVGDRAPRTITSTTRVAPSPSRTTRRAISASTPVTARVNAACWRDPAAIRAFPAAPLASRITVSFVLISSSTVIALSVGWTASRSDARRTRAGTAASVTTNTRSVAMSGAIMPAPLPSAATVTRRPPRRNVSTAVFGKASVVVIASAACGKPPGASAAAAARTPAKRHPGTRTRCARRRSLIRRASRLPVALLVLLAAAARARVVAADLRPVAPDGLDLLQVVRVTAVRERHARRRALATLHRLDLRVQGRDVAFSVLDRHPRARACGGLGAELDAHQLIDDLDLEATHHRT